MRTSSYLSEVLQRVTSKGITEREWSKYWIKTEALVEKGKYQDCALPTSCKHIYEYIVSQHIQLFLIFALSILLCQSSCLARATFLACEAEQFVLLSRLFAASHSLYHIAKTRMTRSDEHVDILHTQVKEKPVCCQIPPGLAYLQDLPAKTESWFTQWSNCLMQSKRRCPR